MGNSCINLADVAESGTSMKYFMQLHPKVPVNALERFLLGEISLQDFEKSFCVNLSYNLLDKPEIYFKLERSES
jgi:hypothetical protein